MFVPVWATWFTFLFTAAGQLQVLWRDRRAHAVECGPAADHGDDGISGSMGAAAGLARDGASFSDELGNRLIARSSGSRSEDRY